MYFLYKLGVFLIRVFPYNITTGLAYFFGFCVYLLSPRKRNYVYKNFQIVLGQKNILEIRKATRMSFINFLLNMRDYLMFLYCELDKISQIVDLKGIKDKLEEFCSSNNGLIIPTAHLGNWELAGFVVGYLGFRAHGIGLSQPDSRIEGIFKKLREKGNVIVHPFKGGAAGVYKALKNNEIATIVSDRDINHDGIKVEFMGKCITFPRGIGVLAYKSGARSAIGYLVRENNKYIARLSEEIIVDRNLNEEGFVQEYVKKFAEKLESLVKKYPDQWFNFFDYFEEYKC
jgi:KDO2-lipid IV(A) lauroyltransferase